MPQRISSTDTSAPDDTARARIAAGLRTARARTGLSEQRVTELLAQQGHHTTLATLQRWEETGIIHVDSAAQLADAYGTTIDALAGRRAFRRSPTDDLPPPARGSW